MRTLGTDRLQDRYLRRIARGEGGFRYEWPDGRPYTSRRGLARIAVLAVPPAYAEVWVSPNPEDELQAFGRDARGRLQYRYHPDFVHDNAMRKWRRLARFAAALPRLRATAGADLRRPGLPRRKVLALLTRLLYSVHFRVGSVLYAQRHRSYGLTTLRKRHVRIEGTRVLFCYRGKHGVVQQQTVRDRTVTQAITRLLALPGAALFQYEDDDGGCHPVRAVDLNAYIREVMGPFTSKDFRTWGGTLKAAEYLATAGVPENERAGSKVLVRCVRAVAAGLGNTAAVTRNSYICPVIFDRYLAGSVLDDYAPGEQDEGLTRSEAALRRMLLRELGRRPHAPRVEATPGSPRLRRQRASIPAAGPQLTRGER